MKFRVCQRVSRIGNTDSGSATVEFVLLALPLFLPIFIYVTQFAEISNKELSARTLVREVVRAYVASENVDAAEQRASMEQRFLQWRSIFLALVLDV
jgi:Flp pilus assembly protein TadG